MRLKIDSVNYNDVILSTPLFDGYEVWCVISLSGGRMFKVCGCNMHISSKQPDELEAENAPVQVLYDKFCHLRLSELMHVLLVIFLW